MNIQRKQLVTSILMLGVLSMVFAVLAFAEKTKEEGHLPERNGQGSGELTAFTVATGLSGLLVPAYRASEKRTDSRSGHHTPFFLTGMRCPSVPLLFYR
nr:hypothetical protein [uncultured Methanoregula sp.]